MVIGPSSDAIDVLGELKLGGEVIEYVSSCRYLGFHILSGTKLKFSSTECIRGFFGSVNSIMKSFSF